MTPRSKRILLGSVMITLAMVLIGGIVLVCLTGDNYYITAAPSGILYYQTVWYTKEQMKNLEKLHKESGDKFAYVLFGDNEEDKKRDDKKQRKHWGNQAGITGKYDRAFAFGITTTWIVESKPEIAVFKELMDMQFKEMAKKLGEGYDVVVPAPKVEKNGVKHELGTGIANLPPEWLLYIQEKLDGLKDQAKEVKVIYGEKRYQK